MENNYSYNPTNIKHSDEPLYQGFCTVAKDDAKGPHKELTPLMLDTTTNKLKLWDGSAGSAVAITIFEVSNLTSDVDAPFYKSGAFKASSLNWPESVTDEQKKVAFIGSPISVFL